MWNENIHSKFKSCLCNYSLKYSILKTISSVNKPLIKHNLLDITEDLIKKDLQENDDFTIDSEYIRNLADKLINELIEERQICKYTLPNSNSEFHYIKLNKNFFSNDVEPVPNKSDMNELSNIEEKKVLIEESKNVEDEKENKLKIIEEIIQLRKLYEKEKKTNTLQRKYIDTLHNYNEAKDMAQDLLGSIAQNKGTTIRQLYEDMSISDDEEK